MHSWNLFEWMEALGQKRPDQPDLVHAIQPVTIVGDQSAHTAPILAPMAWMGGSRTAVAGAYGCIALTSTAPGGTFIRELSWTASAAGQVRWLLNQSPAAMLNLVANLVRQDMGQLPTSSLVRIGTIAAEPATTTIGRYDTVNVGQTRFGPDWWYVPPGWTFQLWFTTVNVTIDPSILFEDCPAQPMAR